MRRAMAMTCGAIGVFRQTDEHQANRTEAHDGDGVAGVQVAFIQATNGAGQRFDEGGVFVFEALGNDVGVLLNDARGQADVFGVSAVIEEKILAEILLAVAAEIAMIARRGVGGDNALAFTEMENAFADGDHIARHFMTEESRAAGSFWRDSRGEILSHRCHR